MSIDFDSNSVEVDFFYETTEQDLDDIRFKSIQRTIGEDWDGSFRDAVIIEASTLGFVGEILINIANVLELDEDLQNYSDTYKEVYGVRPRGDYDWFRKLTPLQRMMEIDSLNKSTDL